MTGRCGYPIAPRKCPTPSPEEQRLTALYRKKGLEALVDELKRF